MTDFQEVGNCGGKITFRITKDDRGNLGFSVEVGKTGGPAALFGVYALIPHGIPVMPFFIGGINQGFSPPMPEHCVPVFMLSDTEGFFGRSCPSCKKYFRTEATQVGRPTICPYCGYQGAMHHFFTEGHHKYVKKYVDIIEQALDVGTDAVIDMDELALRTAPDRPPHYYVEAKQQTRFSCLRCQITSDIMGQFGYCPDCGLRNSLAVLNKQIGRLEERVKNPRYDKDQREEREEEWREIVKQCVSHFESFSRDITSCLIQSVPMTPRRKKLVKDISFHNPIEAAEVIKSCLDIDLLIGISSEQQDFLKKRFLRRNLYEHCSGQVDEKYINQSGESQLRVGQLLRESSSNVATLIGLVQQMVKNYDTGFNSLE